MSSSSLGAEEGGLELKLELEEPEELELEEPEELDCSAASCSAAHALNSKLKAVIIFFLIFANLATLVELELELGFVLEPDVLMESADVKSIIEKERASTCSAFSSSKSARALLNMAT